MDELIISIQSLSINNIDLKAGSPPGLVCLSFLEWLPKEQWVGIGWNYPQFDLRFPNNLLRKFDFGDLGYRGIDLNSLCYFTGADKAALKGRQRKVTGR